MKTTYHVHYNASIFFNFLLSGGNEAKKTCEKTVVNFEDVRFIVDTTKII